MRRRVATLVAATLLVAAPPALADTPPGNVIRVKGVAGDTVVQLLPTEGGGMVRADLMARLLGGSCDNIGDGRWRIALYGTTLEIQAGVAFAAYGGFALPLIEATRVVDGAPHVTLQLFSEIIPRFGIGILWDRTRWEVRLFQGIASAATSRPPARSATGLTRQFTIVVDAGHGGRDRGNPGSIVNGRRVREAELTLAVALALEKELKARGINVYMTRRTDTLIALGDRGRIANEKRGDLFVSIHTNAANLKWKNGAAARGFETYFLSTARTEDEARVAEMENDVVRFEGSSVAPARGDPLSFIMADMAQNEHLRESSDVAATFQSALARVHPGANRGVKQAPFTVLTTAHMPAILVELGFGSNRDDTAWMSSASGRQEAAKALADATVEYLLHFERRTRSSPR